MQPLGDNLTARVEQDQEANSATSEHNDFTPTESIPGASTARRSSFSTSYATLVLHYRVLKLETRMSTLLHHIQPWMQRSISEADEQIERKMAQHTKRNIVEVHQHLDAFEMGVLTQPDPTLDLMTLQAVVDSLRSDLYTILEARVPESEAPSIEPVDVTMLAAVLSTIVVLQTPPQNLAKRQRVRYEDESWARKKEAPS